MPRAKKRSKPFNIRLSLPLWEKVDEYSLKTGIPKTVIVEHALDEYFKANTLGEEKSGNNTERILT